MFRRAVGLGLVGTALIVTIPWAALSHGIGSDAAAVEKARRQSQQSETGRSGTPLAPSQQQQTDAWDHGEPCDRPPGREEADLCQQWRMAKATEELLTTADGQFWATVVEAGLLALTLLATAVAAIAAVLAARAAHASVNVATAMGKRQMRAYVNAYDIRVSNFAPDMIAVFLVTIRNTGATPAYNVKTLITAGWPDNPNSAISFSEAARMSTVVIAGNGGQVEAPVELRVPHIIYEQVAAGKVVITLAGYVRYRDAFKIKRGTTFRAYLRPSSIKKGGIGVLSAAERNNYAN